MLNLKKKIDADSAAVKIPPPLVLLFTILLGGLLHLLWPLPVFHDSAKNGIGAALLVCGFFLMGLCVLMFRKAGTAIPPWKTTTSLVGSGPYRYSRNPIYLGMLILQSGFSALFNSGWGFLLLIPLFLFLNSYVISLEERYLEKKFGEPYQQYLRQVRRWL